jgi:hypothetical protein
MPGESPPEVRIARSPCTEFWVAWSGTCGSTGWIGGSKGWLFGRKLKNLTKIAIFYPQIPMQKFGYVGGNLLFLLNKGFKFKNLL